MSKALLITSELNPTVYPTKYSDNIRFENGTFVLLQSFANFSGYAEESDFTVTVTMQVKHCKALWVFVWQLLSRLSVVGQCVGLGFSLAVSSSSPLTLNV